MSTNETYTLAIDAGTSSLKAVLYGSDGRIEGTSTQWYSYQSEQPGWAEGNPAEWWQAFEDAVADLGGQGFALDRIEAISFSGQMHSAVLLDAQAQVISPTILWLDRRADRETEELQAQLRLAPYQLNSTYTLPKLLWLHRHQPEVLARTHKILWPKDYIRFRLTGEACTDLTDAAGAALLDWETYTWAAAWPGLVGLDASALPPIKPATGSGGSIRPRAAQALGLSPDVCVVVGMGDVAALFGAAPPKAGRLTYSMGSSSQMATRLAAGQRAKDPSDRIYVYPFGPYPMLGGVSSTTGSCLVWACDKLGLGKGSSFEVLVAQALEIEPGTGGLCFIPYLAGERSPHWSDEIRGGFYGLRLNHDHLHLVRAVMEGVAYSLRHLLDVYEEMGVPIDEIAMAGGGTTTQGWPQIMADVCQRDVMIYAGQETVTRVLYALCQTHLGRQTFDESLLQTFDKPDIIRSRRDLGPIYDAGYQRYRSFARFAKEQAKVYGHGRRMR
jgi:xylulokinase